MIPVLKRIIYSVCPTRYRYQYVSYCHSNVSNVSMSDIGAYETRADAVCTGTYIL